MATSRRGSGSAISSGSSGGVNLFNTPPGSPSVESYHSSDSSDGSNPFNTPPASPTGESYRSLGSSDGSNPFNAPPGSSSGLASPSHSDFDTASRSANRQLGYDHGGALGTRPWYDGMFGTGTTSSNRTQGSGSYVVASSDYDTEEASAGHVGAWAYDDSSSPRTGTLSRRGSDASSKSDFAYRSRRASQDSCYYMEGNLSRLVPASYGGEDLNEGEVNERSSLIQRTASFDPDCAQCVAAGRGNQYGLVRSGAQVGWVRPAGGYRAVMDRVLGRRRAGGCRCCT